jgi:hypothetical protein
VKTPAKSFAAAHSEAAVRDVTTLQRGDLGASVAAARGALRAQSSKPRALRAVAAMFAAQALAVFVWYWLDAAGLSEWIGLSAALTITTACSIGFVRSLVRRTRRILQKYQLACPHCGHDMLAIADLDGRLSAVDLTVETGRCSHCGEVSFAA